ncbi:SURF1 family protein [Massilia sp. CF038]|uniref:SURF1 family protein n=1 Tax=Massilia sp. CF038 TaxID=1881045 RepID=UPI000917DC7F|nr:SURF1 family protein [Massilia sp. CF038]SHG62187.1 surfeit locus 1 family protein [Massilia sp. CF038]
MTRSRRARWSVVLCLAVLSALLLALGVWQVQRLQWKQALIAQVDARVHAAPAAAPPPTSWPRLRRDQDEYRHLRLSGRFQDDDATLVQASTVLGPGYWVLTPFRSDDGSTVLVNRGYVPGRAAPPAGPGHTSITGLLRMSERDKPLLRENDPGTQRWYTRNVQAIAAARGLGPVAPYFLDQDATPGAATGAPVGGLTVIAFNNNHLVYAITWFALSLMAAGGCVLVARTGQPSTS